MSNSILLVLSIVALSIPSLFSASIAAGSEVNVEVLSLGASLLMILIYALGIVYTFTGQDNLLQRPAAEDAQHAGHWSLRKSAIVLALATFAVVWMSEVLVGAVEPVVERLGISEFFLGIILIPVVGNVSEHLVAVQVAIRKQMDLSVEIALGSSLQIALFVAPLLVFVSLLFGHPLTLVFNPFELLALIMGGLIAALVSADGESNWLEGAVLLVVYAMLGLAFFLLPV